MGMRLFNLESGLGILFSACAVNSPPPGMGVSLIVVKLGPHRLLGFAAVDPALLQLEISIIMPQWAAIAGGARLLRGCGIADCQYLLQVLRSGAAVPGVTKNRLSQPLVVGTGCYVLVGSAHRCSSRPETSPDLSLAGILFK